MTILPRTYFDGGPADGQWLPVGPVFDYAPWIVLPELTVTGFREAYYYRIGNHAVYEGPEYVHSRASLP